MCQHMRGSCSFYWSKVLVPFMDFVVFVTYYICPPVCIKGSTFSANHTDSVFCDFDSKFDVKVSL